MSSVAVQLDYSSPQSFSRHVRALLNMSAVEFRVRYDGDGMLDCFREQLVLRHLAAWQRFDPFGRSARTIGIEKSTGRARSHAPERTAVDPRSDVAELDRREERKNVGGSGE